MVENKKVQRIKILDMTKGIAIFLVVWGHVIQYGGNTTDFFENKVFILIYSFHMPLFLLVSGYLFSKSIKKYTFIDNIKKKIISIMVPAIVWGIIYCIIKWIVETILGNNVTLNISVFIQQIGNIWFLWTVFMCMMAVLIVDKLVKDVFLIPIFFICILVFFFLPYRDYNVFLFPYFMFGYYAEKKSLRSIKGFENLSLILFPVALLFYDKKHFIYVSGINIFKSDYGMIEQVSINLYRWFIGLVGCFAVLIIVKFFCNKKTESRLVFILSSVGKYSLEIYVMQRILVEYLGAKFMWKIFNKFSVLNNAIIYNYIYTLLLAIFFIVILYYTAVLLENIKNRGLKKLKNNIK